MVTVGGRRHGFEIKYSDAPRRRRSMRTALSDLALDHLWVVYPGSKSYPLDDDITVIPLGMAASGEYSL